jgi:transcription elongation factor GreA
LGDTSNNLKPSLIEAASDFLATVSLAESEKAKYEIYKFVRWYGWRRAVTELSAPNVADYAEQVAPSAIKPIKAFLSYVWKKGWCEANLAVHLRAKKRISKSTNFLGQASQTQSTLTAQGYAEMETKLDSLKGELSYTVEEVRKAAADKDFRENAPLQAAREHQGHLKGRIEELESILKSARNIDRRRNTSGVSIGDAVVVRDIGSGKEMHYILVDSKEANPTRGKISITSPIGRALLGKNAGETIEVKVPAGKFHYHIEGIQHQ